MALFSESVIREITRLADRHGAINLAQGFPGFAARPPTRKGRKLVRFSYSKKDSTLASALSKMKTFFRS
jgi:hypothetical protein